jgi:hypothetical protein
MLELLEIDKIYNNNIIIDGVSGCGKTSFVYKIGNYLLKSKILVLSYTINNKSIDNIDIYDYNSFSEKYYNCIDIKKVLKTTSSNKFSYDIIIIDDVQYISELQYNFIKKIYNDNLNKPYLYIFGDKYSFINTNTNSINYLLLAEQTFNFNNYSWKKIIISNSERSNDKIASFVNNCLLFNDVIKTTKISNNKPKYYICNINTKSLTLINEYLDMGYKNDDLLILSPSLKTNSIKLLIKNLVKQKISISTTKEDNLNKILILPFNEIKDIERKIVIIFNFDSSYLKYYQNINYLYIATMISTEELVLLHHFKYNYLPFLKYNILEQNCNIYKFYNILNDVNKIQQINLNNLSTDIIDNCMKYIDIENIQKSDNNYYIINKFDNNVKDYIISKLNISKNAKYEINKEIIIENYKFKQIIDCIDDNNIYKFIYSENIDNINYILFAIQKYINDNIPINTNFEIYENVCYNNEDYIINKINKDTIEIINLNTAHTDKVSFDVVYKKNYKNKYYLYNIYTNEINIITSNKDKIYNMIKYIISQNFNIN